jgi:hypothetical protein
MMVYVSKVKLNNSYKVMKLKFHNTIVGMLALLASLTQAAAQGTAFTYQGQLQNNGSPASGAYDLTFTLFATNSGGASVGGPVTKNGVLVSNGLFTVLVDFGPGAFTGATNWLEIAVETNGNKAFITLAPRQQLTPAPYAIVAESAGNLLGDLPVSQLSGTLLFSQLPGTVLTNNETSVTLGSLTVGGDLNLSAMGDIFAGSSTLLHADGVLGNFFAGLNAGNLATRGGQNTALGNSALYNNTTGFQNTAIGEAALYSNESGDGNTATGFEALAYNTTGNGNVAEGFQALGNSTNDTGLVAIGFQALQNDNAVNTNGLTFGGLGHNTAIGYQALQADTTGAGNTAVGFQALMLSTNGNFNTAIGDYVLYDNTSGSSNTATGKDALYYNTTGSDNTAVGVGALESVTTGSYNTATGFEALSVDNVAGYTTGSGNTADGAYAMFSDTTGTQNTATGQTALYSNGSGDGNTATGFGALASNTTGNGNVAEGFQALGNSTNDTGLVAVGFQALQNDNAVNTNGLTFGGLGHNTAVGYQALQADTTGAGNTAVGFQALMLSTNGNFNTAIGDYVLYENTSGSSNTANGKDALYYNTTGSDNTGLGVAALESVTTGSYNTATGFKALSVDNLPGFTTGSGNTADGAYAMFSATTGSNNIALGFGAASNMTVGSYNIEIGNLGSPADNDTILIGTQGIQTNTVIAGIYGSTAAAGAPVYVTSAGTLGTLTSSARFKEDIRSMNDASDVLLSLRPVTFHYKPGLDPKATPQFGLVAEEVDQVDPDLVLRDPQHQIYTVRYEAVNAMLLNEFLKQHRKVEEQNTEIQSLKQQNDSLADRLNKLEAMVEQMAAHK